MKKLFILLLALGLLAGCAGEKSPWPSGCLHNQEIILYAPSLPFSSS